MNGVIIINKEKNYTSNDVVRIVKKIFKEKVGHLGTLDPNATGVLPLLIGNATKISKYLINHDKEYEAVLKLGEKRDTADIEGSIIETKVVLKEELKKENVEKVLKSFIGKQEQIPPIYSAIKVKGRKLYDYARKKIEVDIKSRQVEIYSIKLKHINLKENEITFYVKCSKGTYIRSLCEDIASKLQTVGFMKELNRISVGDFKLKNSITIKELENSTDTYKLINIDEVLEFPKIELDKKDLDKYLNGVFIEINSDYDGPCKVYLESKFIGTGIIKNKKLKRDVVI